MDISNEYLFTFVRHPLAWYRSYWCCRTEKGWRKDGVDKHKADTFERFLVNILNRGIPYCTKEFMYYIGEPQVMNYVGLNENMANDLITILTEIGAEFDAQRILDLPRVNASYSKPLCSKELIDMIIRLDHKIVDRYYKGTPFENYVYKYAKGK